MTMLLPCDSTRGKGHKHKEHRKFHASMRKNFYTLELREHWNKMHSASAIDLETQKTSVPYTPSKVKDSTKGKAVSQYSVLLLYREGIQDLFDCINSMFFRALKSYVGCHHCFCDLFNNRLFCTLTCSQYRCNSLHIIKHFGDLRLKMESSKTE